MNNSDDILKNGEDKYCIAEQKFLEEFKNCPVRIFLSNGVKLECAILEHDDVCIIVDLKNEKNKRQLLYKENIATIQEK